jgi:hypothetical protein
MKRHRSSTLAIGSNARFIRGRTTGDARFATTSLSDQHANTLQKRVAIAWPTHQAAAGRFSPLGPQAHLPLIHIGPHSIGQSADVLCWRSLPIKAIPAMSPVGTKLTWPAWSAMSGLRGRTENIRSQRAFPGLTTSDARSHGLALRRPSVDLDQRL